MKKHIILHLILLVYFLNSQGQSINLIGSYNIEMIADFDSKSNIMVLGNGDIVDISDPYNPAKISSIEGAGHVTSVYIVNDYAFIGVGAQNISLQIYDISNPNTPLWKSTTYFQEIDFGIFGMAIKDEVLFLISNDAKLFSIEISDKTSPVILDNYFFEDEEAYGITLSGEFLYVAGDGLKIFNISDSSNIEFIQSIGTPYSAIYAQNNRLFVGKATGGIDVYNIEEPFFPSLDYTIQDDCGTVYSLDYFNNHLYSASNNSCLTIYKIEGNYGDEILNYCSPGGGITFCLSIQDSLILLSDLRNGIEILEYDSAGASGLNTLDTNKKFNVYPNPADDFISIDYNGYSHKVKVEILSLRGNILLSQEQVVEDHKVIVKIKGFPSGIYVLRVDGESCKMFLKN